MANETVIDLQVNLGYDMDVSDTKLSSALEGIKPVNGPVGVGYGAVGIGDALLQTALIPKQHKWIIVVSVIYAVPLAGVMLSQLHELRTIFWDWQMYLASLVFFSLTVLFRCTWFNRSGELSRKKYASAKMICIFTSFFVFFFTLIYALNFTLCRQFFVFHTGQVFIRDSEHTLQHASKAEVSLYLAGTSSPLTHRASRLGRFLIATRKQEVVHGVKIRWPDQSNPQFGADLSSSSFVPGQITIILNPWGEP